MVRTKRIRNASSSGREELVRPSLFWSRNAKIATTPHRWCIDASRGEQVMR